jgi:large subunit ribosomal protein L25
MKSLEIKGKVREVTGKKDSKKLRQEELVPCVIYSGTDPVHFFAPFSEFRPLVYTPDVFQVFVNLDGDVHQTVLQDMQWHPVEEKLLHADFMRITDDKPIRIDLPLTITGTAKGIKSGGKLKVNIRKIKVKGFVKNLPDAITVDVTDLDLSQSIKVGDLRFEGVEFLAPKTNVIATITVTRASKAAATAAEKPGKK